MIEKLRARLGDPRAASFQLTGEDLYVLDAGDLGAEVPPELLAEERALARDVHDWQRRYNRSVHARISGYVALARACELRYPWPIVAVLGIQQVLAAMARNRVAGVAGRVRPSLLRFVDASEDVLRRTNRGIFADSVPIVLRALRGDALARAGKRELAAALVRGDAAVIVDETSRALCDAIARGLARSDERARFTALAATTLDHFAREQAIFTFHMGGAKHAIPAKRVAAPVVERGRLRVRAFALPPGFDMRDHDARVREFGRAFVTSVTSSLDDYRVAARWVLERYR